MNLTKHGQQKTETESTNSSVNDVHLPVSLRDYFAAKAITGLVLANKGDVDRFAKSAYEIADAMLAQRKKTI